MSGGLVAVLGLAAVLAGAAAGVAAMRFVIEPYADRRRQLAMLLASQRAMWAFTAADLRAWQPACGQLPATLPEWRTWPRESGPRICAGRHVRQHWAAAYAAAAASRQASASASRTSRPGSQAGSDRDALD